LTDNTRYFTGIGSRETPPGIKPLIEEACLFLSAMKFVLRSGGAPGADSMFEHSFHGEKEIYLPWKGFNQNTSQLFLDNMGIEIIEKASSIAKNHHPRWNSLSRPAKKLMTRNSFQVIGQDLQTPSSFILCWTKGGTINGGTGQAMRIARHLEIPIFNLFNKDCLHKVKMHIAYSL